MYTLVPKFPFIKRANNANCLAKLLSYESQEITLVDYNREILNQIFKDWKKALAHLYANCHSCEEAEELAEQTVIEFEGAVAEVLEVEHDHATKIRFTINHDDTGLDGKAADPRPR